MIAPMERKAKNIYWFSWRWITVGQTHQYWSGLIVTRCSIPLSSLHLSSHCFFLISFSISFTSIFLSSPCFFPYHFLFILYFFTLPFPYQFLYLFCFFCFSSHCLIIISSYFFLFLCISSNCLFLISFILSFFKNR